MSSRSVRKGFYFTAAGCELPVVWSIMLLVQAFLGDGPYVVKIAALPWDRQPRLQMT
jgi:putative oxidoreductase